MPTPKRIADIKSALLHPATTSHFEVGIGLPKKLTSGGFLSDNGINLTTTNLDRLNLMCCDATLPGSNLATLEVTGDFHGVTEKHAYRRIYDDRIDLTFYVDADFYLPIRVFETWMKFISQESSEKPQPERGNITSAYDNYFYRFQYIDEYSASGLHVTKFEKSSYGKGQYLRYDFVKSYPISISSMPVSYESSNLLKCTVSMAYIRYVLNKVADPGAPGNPSTPIEQAGYNDGFASNSEFFNQDDAYQVAWGASGYTGSPDSKHTKFARSMQAKLSGQFDPEHASQFD
jgi:hypothetical protein|tara:strand:+ start:3770 stop:4636 length:867 start_codon:yes stop_codon:yes gene_type:complete